MTHFCIIGYLASSLLTPTHQSGSISEEAQWIWWLLDYIVSRNKFWRSGLLRPFWPPLNYREDTDTVVSNKLFASSNHLCSISLRKIYSTFVLCKAVETILIVPSSWTQRKSGVPISTCETYWFGLFLPLSFSEVSFTLLLPGWHSSPFSTRSLPVTSLSLSQIFAIPISKNQMKAQKGNLHLICGMRWFQLIRRAAHSL